MIKLFEITYKKPIIIVCSTSVNPIIQSHIWFNSREIFILSLSEVHLSALYNFHMRFINLKLILIHMKFWVEWIFLCISLCTLHMRLTCGSVEFPVYNSDDAFIDNKTSEQTHHVITLCHSMPSFVKFH